MQDIYLAAVEPDFAIMKAVDMRPQLTYHQPLWESFVLGGPSIADVPEPLNYVDLQSLALPPLFERGVEFQDHAFRLSVPLQPREMDRLNHMTKPAIADVKPHYNFYIADYENRLASLRASGLMQEQMLPNMYAFLFEKKSKNLDRDNTIYHRLITLDGYIDNVSKDILMRNPFGEGEVHKVGEKIMASITKNGQKDTPGLLAIRIKH